MLYFLNLMPMLRALADEAFDLLLVSWGRDQSWTAPNFRSDAALPYLSGGRPHETTAKSVYEFDIGEEFVEKLYNDDDG